VTNTLALRQQRDLREIISTAFSIYRIPPVITKLLVLSLPGTVIAASGVWATYNLQGWTGLLPFAIWFVEGAVVGSGAMYALDRLDQGFTISIIEALARTWAQLTELLVAAAITLVIVAAFCITVVGIPWGIARYIRWSFTSQAIMIDGVEGEASLEHSATHVAGRGWPTFWSLFAIEMIVQIPLWIVVGALTLVSNLPNELFGLFITSFAFPFRITARTLLYYDLKMRKALA
jgi:hypothetical protein